MDKRYIQLLSKGDVRAFDWLFLRYQPKVVAFINGFLKNTTLSEDMAQDIFLQVWENKQRFVDVEYLQSFLFKMAKNRICNYFDHLQVEAKYQSVHSPEEHDISYSPEELLFASELDALIDRALEGLTSQQKIIFQKNRFEGYSNAEIADQLGISKRTVENHLTTALAHLRRVTKQRNTYSFLFAFFV